MYTIRQTISKTWPIPRKGTKYVVVASHEKELGAPLLIVMRDLLEFVKTRKELKRIINEKRIYVDGVLVKDEKQTLALFDVLSFKDSDTGYRITFSKSGKLNAKEIKNKEFGSKISKVIGKKILRGGKTQINFMDGRNLFSNEKVKVGDSVKIDFANKKIVETLPIKKGSEIMIIKGKHRGKAGNVLEMRDEENEVIVKVDERDLKIKEEELIVIG